MEMVMDPVVARWTAQETEVRSRLKVDASAPASLAGLTGMELFAAIFAGDIPPAPIGLTLDFIPIHMEPGVAVFQGRPQRRHYNPLGSVHGGYIATLLDSCMGCAVHTLLKTGQGYTTADLRVSYIRALRSEAGPVRAEGRIIHVGRSTALAEGRLYDVDERLYAVASTTCLILDMNAPRQNGDAGVR